MGWTCPGEVESAGNEVGLLPGLQLGKLAVLSGRFFREWTNDGLLGQISKSDTTHFSFDTRDTSDRTGGPTAVEQKVSCATLSVSDHP
jgi:hypothetical protein